MGKKNFRTFTGTNAAVAACSRPGVEYAPRRCRRGRFRTLYSNSAASSDNRLADILYEETCITEGSNRGLSAASLDGSVRCSTSQTSQIASTCSDGPRSYLPAALAAPSG